MVDGCVSFTLSLLLLDADLSRLNSLALNSELFVCIVRLDCLSWWSFVSIIKRYVVQIKKKYNSIQFHVRHETN